MIIHNSFPDHVTEDASNKNGGNAVADEVSEPPLKKKKKAVSWPDESKLCSFFYFQLDETERGKTTSLLINSEL